MPERRTYDTAGRRAAATRNRDAVLHACRDLVLANGYRATTVKAVADRAGVSAETVYKGFGGKKQLMKAVYDITLAGDTEPVPIGRRPAIKAAIDAADPADKIRLYAHAIGELLARISRLVTVLAEADPEIAEIRAATEDERLAGVRQFVTHLAESGTLRPGADVDLAADACWALTAPAMFTQLTATRGWSQKTYEDWLARTLSATLI